MTAAAERERVRIHADRGTAFVDALHAACVVEQAYDEVSVTAEFDDGEISGLIDHLVVTPDASHIVDDKTNDITAAEVDATADYYRTQLAAYAIALHQQNPDRQITATLYFTAPDDAVRFEWTPGDITAIRDDLREAIREAMQIDIENRSV